MKELRSVIIVCVALIFIAGIASLTFMNRGKTDDTISITGMGKLDFESDWVVWRASWVTESKVLAKAYDQVEQEKRLLMDFLSKAGFKATEIQFKAIGIDKSYKPITNAKGDVVDQEFEFYRLIQEFSIESAEVEKITGLSSSITDLIRQGLEIQSGPPEYFYTKMADLKLKLIALASLDAKARATEIVTNSNAALGRLRSSSLGVFQIIGANQSPESSNWEGTFDTSSKLKTATVTVHAYYEIR